MSASPLPIRAVTLGLVALGLPLLAQNEGPNSGPAGIPAIPQPAPNPNAPDPGQILREDQIFPKLTGDELADLYFRFTGRRVTSSVEAASAEFRFIQRAPLTYGEAAQLLKRAALLQGFVFVPDANMANHDILVVATAGANPKGEGLEVVIDAADLPEDDRVVSYVMPLDFIKPDEIVRTFTTVVGQFGPYGSITPVPNAGAVVITEKTSLIRRLIELKEKIDVSASVATQFIKVQYADVTELAETLNEILGTQAEGQRTAGVQRVQNNAPAGLPEGVNPAAAAGAAAAGGGSSAAEDVPIQIVGDSRTNRIFAMGRPVDILFIEGLVRDFDVQTDARNYLRRKLKFVAVSDFLNIAEPALQRAFSGLTDGAGAGGAGGRSTGANFGDGRTGGASSRNNNSRTNSTFGGGGFGGANTGLGGGLGGGGGLGAGGGGFGGAGLQDPNINTAPEARLVGRTLLVADNITNSLVVQGPPASVEIITNLLDQIDVKAEQVMISAVFGQLSLGEEFDFGVDYVRTLSGSDDGAFAGRGGGGLLPVAPLNGTPLFPGGANPFGIGGGGLTLYGRIGENFNVLVSALQADSRFKVLSRPTIFTSNNRKGTISSGQRIAVPTSTFQGAGLNGFSTNVQYQNVFLTLEVVPLVNSDDEVTLEIALINEELGQDREVDNLVIPDILSRQVLTSVTVPNGSTIALGGLITSRMRDTVSGIPLLSDIPGIGALFSRTSEIEDRSELMVFIQPQIVKDPRSLLETQIDMDARYTVSDEARDFAAPAVVLPERGAVPEQKGQAPVVAPVEEEPAAERRRRSALWFRR